LNQFYVILWGVSLSQLGTPVTLAPIVPSLDANECVSYPCATLRTTIPTRRDPRWETGDYPPELLHDLSESSIIDKLNREPTNFWEQNPSLNAVSC
jgi:hypothetical protein